jgi:thiol-disulfide isomerase/thioredoxin
MILPQQVATDAADRQTTTPSLVRLLTSQTRETFVRISSELEKAPDSPDTAATRRWLLETAREFGWEAEAIPSAERLLKHPTTDAQTRRLAHESLAIGHSRAGRLDESAAALDSLFRTTRLRNPNPAAEVVEAVSVAWQLQGRIDAATAAYDQLETAFFLNAELREYVATRKERFALVGQPLPEFTAIDLAGSAVASTELDGDPMANRIVLLDFWATNCRPCVEGLPELRRLHQAYDAAGVTFVGVSFDEEAAAIETFRQTEPVPWRVFLGRELAETKFAVARIPCLMVVDRAGKLAAVDVPPRELKAVFHRLLDWP